MCRLKVNLKEDSQYFHAEYDLEKMDRSLESTWLD